MFSLRQLRISVFPRYHLIEQVHLLVHLTSTLSSDGLAPRDLPVLDLLVLGLPTSFGGGGVDRSVRVIAFRDGLIGGLLCS